MAISCLSCGKGFGLPSHIDQEFEGEVRCPYCTAVMYLRLNIGKISKQKLVAGPTRSTTEIAEGVSKLVNIAESTVTSAVKPIRYVAPLGGLVATIALGLIGKMTKGSSRKSKWGTQ